MASDPLAGHRVLGFDLETTGLNSKQHRIVQFALIGCDSNGEEIHIEDLVNPQRKIPPEVTNIHGISDFDVRNSPSFKFYAEQIYSAISGSVLIGHNIEQFDWPFLKSEFLRVGMLMPEPLVIIDTLKIARKLKLPPRHQLASLCRQFNISLENAHTAGADAAATLLLLHKMMAAHPQHFRRPVEDIPNWTNSRDSDGENTDRLGPSIEDLPIVDGSNGWMREASDGVIISRGRNRGRTLSEIRISDPSYLNWLLSPAGPLEKEALDAVKASEH
ncbi:MAG: 3'-5' exonuclease [Candidatus Thalassarchaeaceae archaeon]|jgi:DNA polymerase-3 subunit epsilon|nr:3'-5' exonuclease [Candidatus Thalassarchaeaceae archaeon]